MRIVLNSYAKEDSDKRFLPLTDTRVGTLGGLNIVQPEDLWTTLWLKNGLQQLRLEFQKTDAPRFVVA